METMETMEELDRDLIPSNPNLTRLAPLKKRKEKKIKLKIGMDTSEPKAMIYAGDLNPFKDARVFNSYYRGFLSFMIGNEVVFGHMDSECLFAAQILDLLIEKSRIDKVFLNAWLKYFVDTRLKGKKHLKTKYTSLKTLKDTFEKFNVLFGNNVV